MNKRVSLEPPFVVDGYARTLHLMATGKTVSSFRVYLKQRVILSISGGRGLVQTLPRLFETGVTDRCKVTAVDWRVLT